MISFWTQASQEVGLGHFMRCYALAQEATARGMACTFVMPQASDFILERLHRIAARWLPRSGDDAWTQTAEPSVDPAWWVVDSYQADLALLGQLREQGKLLVIDDLCALASYPCDLILNASGAAHELPYPRKSQGARLLLGPSFSLIRREFQRDARRSPQAPGGQRVLIMMGGSDPLHLTEPVLRHLHAALPDAQFTVILGFAASRPQHLRAVAQSIGRTQLLVDPTDLAQHLDAADVVVTAAGGSVGELCALNQMAVVLVVVDNQVGALRACPYPTLDARLGVPAELGATVLMALTAQDRNQGVIDRARSLVDGMGCRRVVDIMQELA